MNANEQALIERVLEAAGRAGEQGFEYAVRYAATSAWTGLVVDVWVITLAAGLISKLLRWKPEDDCSADIKHFVRGAALVVLSCVAVACMFDASSNLAVLIEPEGAAIRSLLKQS